MKHSVREVRYINGIAAGYPR